MGLINTAASNLLGGVSQQSKSLRGGNNCEEQVNAYPSPVEGLMKRHGTEFMTQRLFNTATGHYYDAGLNIDTATHIINRDSSERYLVTIRGSGNAISVWDLVNNEEKTVYYDEDRLNFLGSNTPATEYKFVTVGDVTFISNRYNPRLVEQANYLTDPIQPTGMVHVRQGAHNTSYYVDLNGTQYAYHVGSSGTANKTDTIAAGLAEVMNGTVTIQSHSMILGTSTQSSDNSPLRMQIAEADMTLEVGDTIRVGATSNFSWNAWLYTDLASNNSAYFAKGDEFKVSSLSGSGPTRDVFLESTTGRALVHHSSFGSSSQNCVWEHLGGNNTNTDDYTIHAKESTITVNAINPEHNDFSLEARDTVGDTYIKAFKNKTQYFSDLPTEAYNGTKLEITGNAESGIDNYYVEFKTNSGTFGQGVWEETVGFSQTYRYYYGGMPHILIRQSDGTFLFKSANGVTTPTNVTAGYVAPLGKTLSTLSSVGAHSSPTTSYTIDGLRPKQRVKKGSDIKAYNISDPTVLEASEYTTADATADESGVITVTVAATLGAMPDNNPMKIHLSADYDSYFWESRKAGDETTNPDPAFVTNGAISDMFLHENRLGIISGENVTLSEAGQFFNFFRTTVIDLLDTAPIEVVGSSNSVNALRHAIPFNGNLLLFADNAQFMLGSGKEGLSPKNVSMRQVGTYECDPDCKPITLGTSVFFGYPRGEKGGLREMVVPDVEATDLKAFDISEHVPSYIDTPFRMLASMPQENLIIGVCKNRPLGNQFSSDSYGINFNSLYLYKYLDRANERIQSAWFRYDIESRGDYNDMREIIAAHVIENNIYIVFRNAQRSNSDADTTVYNKYILTKLTIENTTGTLKAAEKPLLDELISYDGADSTDLEKGVTAAYDSGTHQTTFTLPVGGSASSNHASPQLEGILAYLKNPDGSVGDLLPLISTVTSSHYTTVTYAGDLQLSSIWFGRDYQMKYEYSSPILRGPAGAGGASEILTGRYQINSANIAYNDSGNFDVSVEAQNGSTYSYPQNAVSSDTHEVAGVRIPAIASNELDRLDFIDVYDYAGYRIRFQTQTGKDDAHTNDQSPNYHLTGSEYINNLGVLHVYVNVYGMTAASQVAAEFVKAINARTDLKVTARQCGVDIPFTSGELPLSHEDRDETVGSQAGVVRTFILIQDVAGTAASTLTNGGLTIGGLSPDNDPVDVVGWAFGVTDGFANRTNPNPNATETGHINIPIHSENSEYKMTVTSTSPRPVKILSTEFEANYSARSSRKV